MHYLGTRLICNLHLHRSFRSVEIWKRKKALFSYYLVRGTESLLRRIDFGPGQAFRICFDIVNNQVLQRCSNVSVAGVAIATTRGIDPAQWTLRYARNRRK